MTEDALFDAYIASHPKSRALHEQATSYFAGDGVTAVPRMLKPFRPFITHAKGS